MTVTLSVDVAETITGTTGVTDDDITAALNLIQWSTGYTPDQHNTQREIPSSMVRQAWAIVAARVGQGVQDAATVDGQAVTGESQSDYSYSLDVTEAENHRSDPLHGLPRTLLLEASAYVTELRPGQQLVSPYSQWPSYRVV